MLDVGTVRPAGDAIAVQKQLETLIRADVKPERRGGRGKLFAKAQQDRVPPPAHEGVGVRHPCHLKFLWMPQPRSLINGLNRADPSIAEVQALR